MLLKELVKLQYKDDMIRIFDIDTDRYTVSKILDIRKDEHILNKKVTRIEVQIFNSKTMLVAYVKEDNNEKDELDKTLEEVSRSYDKWYSANHIKRYDFVKAISALASNADKMDKDRDNMSIQDRNEINQNVMWIVDFLSNYFVLKDELKDNVPPIEKVDKDRAILALMKLLSKY